VFRRAQLEKLLGALQANETALLEALRADLGKTAYHGFTTEIGLVLSELRYALRKLEIWTTPGKARVPWIAWPGNGTRRPEPFGVVLIIGTWNYPVQLLFSPLVSALAAGNCVILKPSEFAPHTARVVERMIRETFSADYVSVATGGPEVVDSLMGERLDKVFFTGSTRVGKLIMAAAAKHLTPVTLELGGKSPCIVCADAPLEVTARRIVWGKFMNAGQTCIAPDFVLADRSIREPLVKALVAAIQEFYGTEPRESADYGRIINRLHWDRLTGYLKSGRVLYGGQHDAGELYLAPTIVTDLTAESPLNQEEIFGPILPVIEYGNLEEALAFLVQRPAPLALYLFSNSRSIQERVLAETRSGGVCINDTILHMIAKDLPFGGFGESGMGAYHGKAGFDCFTHYRSVLRRGTLLDPPLRYPPPRVSIDTIKRAFKFLLGA
jgi:aldehyde dehydrogenase (NAD+)